MDRVIQKLTFGQLLETLTFHPRLARGPLSFDPSTAVVEQNFGVSGCGSGDF